MKFLSSIVLLSSVVFAGTASAENAKNCDALPDHKALKEALVKARNSDNGGLNLDMWGSIVDRAGRVCAVAYTGKNVDSQWPGSRLISAQKANTANAFSFDGLALSTANLFSAVQPGNSLFGLQESNPINVNVAYNADSKAEDYGSKNDPLVGQLIGGVNVFGGGLALYNKEGSVVGAIGVSGDTSCADHNIAWRLRNTLGLDYVPAGVSATKDDQIIFDIDAGKSAGGFGHAKCGADVEKVLADLPKVSK